MAQEKTKQMRPNAEGEGIHCTPFNFSVGLKFYKIKWGEKIKLPRPF